MGVYSVPNTVDSIYAAIRTSAREIIRSETAPAIIRSELKNYSISELEVALTDRINQKIKEKFATPEMQALLKQLPQPPKDPAAQFRTEVLDAVIAAVKNEEVPEQKPEAEQNESNWQDSAIRYIGQVRNFLQSLSR